MLCHYISGDAHSFVAGLLLRIPPSVLALWPANADLLDSDLQISTCLHTYRNQQGWFLIWQIQCSLSSIIYTCLSGYKCLTSRLPFWNRARRFGNDRQVASVNYMLSIFWMWKATFGVRYLCSECSRLDMVSS